MAKIRRNDPCPCGSGKKYKKCCGDPLPDSARSLAQSQVTDPTSKELKKKAAEEAVRIAQQGRGKPIISANVGDYTVVATGTNLSWSKKWKTFPDFLGDYIKNVLGSEWGNSEISKAFDERHPILQWYDALCRLQRHSIKNDGAIISSEMNGAACCYLGLAYNLYLIKHNVQLQDRLVARLKDIRQFQGAYYELIVANCLLRAGFELELEDEADLDVKHCEFSARSAATNKRYWIEAKMRSVSGILGKTRKDGSTSNDPTSRLSKHLNEALRKPAPDERMIFIDINAPPTDDNDEPRWLGQAVRRLEDRERNLAPEDKAYVFVTNMAFHRTPGSTETYREALAYGLGLPDFSKPGPVTLPDWYKRKRKHIDAHTVFETFRSYPQIPNTFDGHPPSESFENSKRIYVGETYFFEDIREDGVLGTVTSVAVLESEKRAYIAIQEVNGNGGMILSNELSDRELEDYLIFGDAYFGEPEMLKHKSNNIFEVFEWLVGCYSKTPRNKLLELAKDHPQIELIRRMDTKDVVLKVCEGWAMSMHADSQESAS